VAALLQRSPKADRREVDPIEVGGVWSATVAAGGTTEAIREGDGTGNGVAGGIVLGGVIRFAAPAGAAFDSFFAGRLTGVGAFADPAGLVFAAPALPARLPRLCAGYETPCAASAEANPALGPRNCAAAPVAGMLGTPLEMSLTIAFMHCAFAKRAEARSTSMHSRHHLRICPNGNEFKLQAIVNSSDSRFCRW
jgi:hypothetical protein